MKIRSLFLNLSIALVFVFGMASFSSAQTLQKIPGNPQGYITDTARLLSSADARSLGQYARELEQKTTAQVAVLTVGTTSPEDISSYAVRVFDQWKIGQAGKDNGVLIVVAVKDRKAWIATGYGMEGALPDVMCHRIVNDIMIPSFKMGNFSKGIKDATIATISLVAKEYGVAITGQEAAVHQRMNRKRSPLESVVRFIFTVLFMILIVGTRSGFLTYFLFGSMMGSRRGYWGGSSGGFGGGFGGFGGGMSGGGGGGGGW